MQGALQLLCESHKRFVLLWCLLHQLHQSGHKGFGLGALTSRSAVSECEAMRSNA